MSQVLETRNTLLMLAVVFFATFMDGLDNNIVNVALPTIGTELGVDAATVSWIVVVYSMVLAGLLVMFARIAADTGVRRVMTAGLGVFTLGSLLCGISSFVGGGGFALLIASRAVQAVGAAMMGASGPMCCAEHLPPEKLAFGLAVVTIGASVGFALGPAIGGLMVEYLPWHWIFFVNIPVGLAIMPVMLRAVPKSAEKRGGCLDYAGTALLFAAIALGTFALEEYPHPDARAASVIAAVACTAISAAFILWEGRAERPLLDLGMFARPGFSAIFLCLLLINTTYIGVYYLIPFYSETVMGNDSLTTGLLLLFSAAVTAFTGMSVAKWSDLRGRRPFCMAAAVFAGSAYVVMAALADGMTSPLFLLPMLLMGLGWSFVGGPMASRLVEHAGEDRDMASSLTNEAYYIGGTAGTALIALLFASFSGSEGVDIDLLTADQLLDGYVPCMAAVALICALIFVLSAAVGDGGKRSLELGVCLRHELFGAHDEPLVEPGADLAEPVPDGHGEADAGAVRLHDGDPADDLHPDGGRGDVLHVDQRPDGGVALRELPGHGVHRGLLHHEDHPRGGQHWEGAAAPGQGRVLFLHGQAGLVGHADGYHARGLVFNVNKQCGPTPRDVITRADIFKTVVLMEVRLGGSA